MKIILLSGRSSNCIQQNHSNCNGIIINSQIDNEVSRICNCPCHNNMYQLIKKASAALRINENDNLFEDKI
ncbi:MAG TPA: hypothetical protein VHJ38_18550 [Nitrososphaeraceae archaeon]|jgi:hypothetical protein|nr:hypothetical protein [Nitrososphaeraceae archaeon]HSF00908.1 hypothetical protein [Nitrososphaeraceae archaeon]